MFLSPYGTQGMRYLVRRALLGVAAGVFGAEGHHGGEHGITSGHPRSAVMLCGIWGQVVEGWRIPSSPMQVLTLASHLPLH